MAGKFNLQLLSLFSLSSPEVLCAFAVIWEQRLFISLNRKESPRAVAHMEKRLCKAFGYFWLRYTLLLLSPASLSSHLPVSFRFLLLPMSLRAGVLPQGLCSPGKHEALNNSYCPFAVYHQPLGEAFSVLETSVWHVEQRSRESH